MEPVQKRRRIEKDSGTASPGPESLSRPISPPPRKKLEKALVKSPWQLTWVRDVPEEDNKDAVTLRDILGDPLIAECWEFNFLHDIDFLMDAFDDDVQHLVKVHIVHGFWKRDDANRIVLEQEALSFPNVQLHVAPMPEMFGTHHSKMMILFRHDSTAQVVIHTANMIPKDWTNLTNAVWMSPMLPKLDDATATESNLLDSQDCPLGSGAKFKTDLLNYLRSYDSRRVTCKALVDQLSGYDFSTVNATLVASVPGRHDVNDVSQTPWGWVALGRHLKSVHSIDGDSEVVVQISSIATLGAKDDWLQKTLFQSLAKSANTSSQRPRFKIIFPTQDEIRGSLGGYASGGSIHMRIQSQQQAKQLQYMRPIFHRWANTGQADIATRKFDAEEPEEGGELHGSGCRERAAPHIKTYIRYNSKGSLDWALLTSANLSKQAWGEAVSASNMVRIASWEIGVLFWPSLFSNDTVMVPTLMADTPSATQLSSEAKVAVGIRVPYGLPLSSYKGDDVPWVASMAHTEPDWSGRKWP